MAAAQSGAPGPADGIQFVNENQRRRGLAGVQEHVPYPGGADTHKHFDKFRGADAEEGHLCLAGNGARQKRFAGARWPHQKHTFGHFGTQGPVFFRRFEEIDDLRDLAFRRFDPGDIIQRGGGGFPSGQAGFRLAVVERAAALGDSFLGHAPEPEHQCQQKDPGQETAD